MKKSAVPAVINTVFVKYIHNLLFFDEFKKLTSIGVGCNAALHSVVTNFLKLYFVCIEVGTR